jgi:hypothetical protein
MKGIGEYTNLLTGVGCNLHPSSALYGLGCVLISPLQLQCAAANFSYQPATLSPHPHLPIQTFHHSFHATSPQAYPRLRLLPRAHPHDEGVHAVRHLGLRRMAR